MTVRPTLPHSNISSSRISRKITLNADAKHINVRPVIKGAINEAGHTLADAYANNPLLSWIVHPLKEESKQHDIRYLLFKAAVNSASLQSRDFAIQVDGCKGVCVWSTNQQQLSFAKVLGWKITKMANLSVAMSKKRIMKTEPHIYINYMGVLPQERNKGLGTALIQHVISKAEEAHLPIYIIVSDKTAVPFFEKLGFQVKEVAHFNDITSTMLVRPVATASASPCQLKLKPGRRDSDDSL
ncbi:hypothetical protein K450DRAFT_231872 [Umbelopsis ramanniana AG]|uniref:N-acetyltransferase domain-containing protein n=1 Tax=Umbelopsis ramanniana AG TaxID=1314678 RepID=A0AAD5HGW3_UMBRA|nr:uncharacterized protein K450DRAFT_231872 [Umbelopsis ramanniana AG]KAI8581553.1 hypothetical protein K450DRAFT_231872 [Umbelopsis ramanniana AG]